MKKIFLLTIAFCTAIGFTSCQNEDIEIVATPTTISVDTKSVVDFKGLDAIEALGLDPDEIMTISRSDYRLRVRNLIYDKDGILRQESQNLCQTYYNTVKTELNIPNGNYTVVTITDVVKIDGNEDVNFRYWELNDSTRLSTINLTSTRYISQYGVLSYAVTPVSVTGDGRTVNVSPKPAGSLYYVMHYNIESLQTTTIGGYNLTDVQFETKANDSGITFDENSMSILRDTSTDYDWRISSFDKEKWDYYIEQGYKNIYSIGFSLELKKVPSIVAIYTEKSGISRELGTVNFNAGGVVFGYIDCEIVDGDFAHYEMGALDEGFWPSRSMKAKSYITSKCINNNLKMSEMQSCEKQTLRIADVINE